MIWAGDKPLSDENVPDLLCIMELFAQNNLVKNDGYNT